MKCEEKGKAKQRGGALGGRKATVWASPSGPQGNVDSVGCAERTRLEFTQTKPPPLPSGRPARGKCWAGHFMTTIPFYRGRQGTGSLPVLSQS